MIVRFGKKKISFDNCIHLFIAGLFLLPLYLDLFSTLADTFGFSTTVTTYLYYIGLWALLLLSLPSILRSLKLVSVLTGIIVLGVAVLLHYLFYPESRDYISGTDPMLLFTFNPQTILAVLPYLLLGLAVTDVQKLCRVLCMAARIGITIGTFSYLLSILNGHELVYDDMVHAYALSILTCLLILFYRKQDLVFVILGALSIILAGTRGAAIAIIVAALMKLFFIRSTLVQKLLGVVIGIFAIVLINTDLPLMLLEGISELFARIGVTELRFVDYAREGMLLDSTGRDDIVQEVLAKIKENPVFGFGLGADRLYTQTHTYAHNIFLELWISCGILFGTAAAVAMAYPIIKTFLGKNLALRQLTAALFCSIVIKLMFSSSFLYSKELFLMLGICLAGGIWGFRDQENTEVAQDV